MSHLEKDEFAQFFNCWNELFVNECCKPAEVISLEFNIHLYFVTFPLRKSPPVSGFLFIFVLISLFCAIFYPSFFSIFHSFLVFVFFLEKILERIDYSLDKN